MRKDHRQVREERKVFLGYVFAIFAVLAVHASMAAQQQALTPPTDPAAVERGGQLLREQCGFCHGANARGGSGGPDLTRSVIVQEDENGVQLGAFLLAGRADRGMPRFEFTAAQNADLAAFLHAAIYQNSNRRLYKILDVLVGDLKAGEAYFSGAGRCRTCHSATGDLKGIGSKFEPAALQNRFLMPRGRPSSPGSGATPLYLDPTAIKATVTTPTETVTGALIRLTDFDVTLYDAAARKQRSWLRNGDSPKVTLTDPLQAHVDHLAKWTDAGMHDMTAFLASLK